MPDIDINVTSTDVIVDVDTDTQEISPLDTYPVYGPRGKAGTIAIGSVTSGDVASVTNSGTNTDAIFNFVLPKGETGQTGATGNGISSISKTATAGLVDTYTVLYTNTNTDTFTVTNGKDGEDGQNGRDGFSPIATVTKSGGVSTLTVTDKNGTTTTQILDGTGTITDVQVNSTSVVESGVANISISAVGLSNSYNDLDNKPTIPAAQVQADWNEADTDAVDYIKNKPTIPTVPTNISAFTNDSGYITGITSTDVTTALGYTPYDSSNPSGYTSNVGTITDVQVNGVSVVTSGVANVVITGGGAAGPPDYTATKTLIANKAAYTATVDGWVQGYLGSYDASYSERAKYIIKNSSNTIIYACGVGYSSSMSGYIVLPVFVFLKAGFTFQAPNSDYCYYYKIQNGTANLDNNGIQFIPAIQ